MASQCTCGAGGGSGGGAQPKKLLKRRTTKKGEKENPYSDRGVEKFSALLAELEEKKRTIYSKFSPEEVSVIRFVHDGDNKLKPVVVRANSNKLTSKRSKTMEVEEDKPIEDVTEQETQKKIEIIESGVEDEEKKTATEKKILSMEKKILSMETMISGIQPSNYRVILVLVLLMAVLGWYWKNYYLLQLQATVCPRIQTSD